VAGVLALVTGLVLSFGGLSSAANVAQVISLVLSFPTLVGGSIGYFFRSRETSSAEHPSVLGNAITAERDAYVSQGPMHIHQAPAVRGPSTLLKPLVIVVCLGIFVFSGVELFASSQSDIQDHIATGPPLGVTVQTRESAENNGAWLFPGRPLAPHATLSWAGLSGILAKRADKTDTYETTTLITLEGRRAHTVVITGMHLKVLSRTTPALGGTLLVDPPQGEDDTIKIGFDLDDDIPVARNLNTQHARFGEPYFNDYTVSFKKGEETTFGIMFRTVKSDVTYDLVLDEVVDGKPTEQVVANGSRPFRTRGFAPAYDQVLAPSQQTDGWSSTSRAAAMTQMCGTPCTTWWNMPH